MKAIVNCENILPLPHELGNFFRPMTVKIIHHHRSKNQCLLEREKYQRLHAVCSMFSKNINKDGSIILIQ